MKKFLALLLAVLMLSSLLVACGGDGDSKNKSVEEQVKEAEESGEGTREDLFGEDNIKLTVWAAEKAQDFTRKACDDFIAQYPDKTIKIDVKTQGEGDVSAAVANDPEKAADVFSFACDQLDGLIGKKLLNPVYNDYTDEVTEANSDYTIAAATAPSPIEGEDDCLWAFPETGENGYYLVYDTNVVTEDDAKTLEGVLAACKAHNKKFILNCGNGFFSCIFPFTGGLKCNGHDSDGIQTFAEYNKTKVLDSLEAFATLLGKYSDTVMDADAVKIGSGFADNPRTVGAGIDGSWNAAIVQETLGSDFGAAKLPQITIKGEKKDIVSVKGCKFIGVNAETKFPETAQLLALYLTSEKVQKDRLEQLQWAPSNKKLLASDEFKEYKALDALMQQAEVEGNSSQTDIVTSFWGPFGTLGKKVLNGASRDVLEEEFDIAMENFE